MKTKIVYVLVSTDEDYYIENLLMSIYSLRQFHKDVMITVVTNSSTYTTLKGKRTALKKYVDSFVQVDVPAKFDKRMTSRFLKVNLRKIIKGTYLFLDTDTIITGDLSPIDNCTSDIAMVLDANSHRRIGNTEDQSDKWINDNADKVKWESLEGEFHYNSGVIYAKDTKVAYKLYEAWSNNWLICAEANIYCDEPALSKANKDTGRVIDELPDSFNWQIQRHGKNIPKKTRVIHYFSNCVNRAFYLAQDKVMDEIKVEGNLTESIIKYIKILQTFLAK